MTQSAAIECRNTIEAGGCVVLAPGLLASAGAKAQLPDTRRLCRILGLAQQMPLQATCALESLVMASVLPAENVTSAALLTYKNDFSQRAGDSNDNLQVLRADPCYQQIDMNNATLTDPALLVLEAAESLALVDTLNNHFAADGLSFEFENAQRWYVCFKKLPDIGTTPLSLAIGQDVTACKPTGADVREWRSWLAEIEMLLFEHPVNTARQARNLLPVNTLWLWGEGRCDSNTTMPLINFVTDNFYTQSLAHSLGQTFGGLGENELQMNQTEQSATIFVTDKLAASAVSSDENFHLQELQWFERIICNWLWRNLKNSGWPVILIWCGDKRLFRLQVGDKYKVWRKPWLSPRPLSAFNVADLGRCSDASANLT